MENKPFIPKEHVDLPDFYTMRVIYIDGTYETFELVGHEFSDSLLKFTTKEDTIQWIFPSQIRRVEFDKQFSKIIYIAEQKKKEQAQE